MVLFGPCCTKGSLVETSFVFGCLLCKKMNGGAFSELKDQYLALNFIFAKYME